MIDRFRILGVVVALALVATACGDDDDTSEAALETNAPAETNAVVETDAPTEATGTDETVAPVETTAAEDSTTGLKVSGVTFDPGNAFIINDGDTPIDLTGHWICNRPNYSPLPGIELAPGEGIEVAVPGISSGGGEVAIYTSNDFDSSDAIISYVQWGDGGGRSGVAEDAGIWSGPPVAVTSDGVFLIGEPGSATSWE